jgi:hypothetical protein
MYHVEVTDSNQCTCVLPASLHVMRIWSSAILVRLTPVYVRLYAHSAGSGSAVHEHWWSDCDWYTLHCWGEFECTLCTQKYICAGVQVDAYMYVYISCVYVHVCVYYTCICICMYMYMYMCVYVYVYAYAYIYVCVWICVCVYMFMHMYVCMYVYIYIYIYIYIYTYNVHCAHEIYIRGGVGQRPEHVCVCIHVFTLISADVYVCMQASKWRNAAALIDIT